MNRKDLIGIVSILIGCLIVAVLYVIFTIHKSSAKEPMVSNIADCFTSQGQCGIHLIIEDSEFEDPTLDLIEGWLEANTFNLSEEDRTKGLDIIKHLKSLTYDERVELISKSFQLYMQRNLP